MFKKKKDEDRRQKVAINRVVLSDSRVEGDVKRHPMGKYTGWEIGIHPGA